MNTSKTIPVPGAGGASPSAFRLRFMVAMMFVISTITVLAAYLAQRSAREDDQRILQDEFQSRLGFMHGVAYARQPMVSERCRLLARSPRIAAALEENDVEDLYANARIELRDVLEENRASVTATPRAIYLRFLSAHGDLLKPLGEKSEQFETDFAVLCLGPDCGQQTGYVAMTTNGVETRVAEIFITPIINSDGEFLGSLVLGFPPADTVAKPEEGLKTGVWVDHKLHMPGLDAGEVTALSGIIAKAMQTPRDDNMQVTIGGKPWLLFRKLLNPGSMLPPAWEVSLYSLEDSVRRQHQLLWRIAGIGFCFLLVGLAASHYFSVRLSKPVEKLAEDSAQNLALREEAEAALELTEQKYRSIFLNAVEGIFLMGPDGRYFSANPAMARIFGYDSPQQLVLELDNPEVQLYDVPDRCAELLRQVGQYGMVTSFESPMRRREGNVIWVSQNARAVRDDRGGLLYIEGTMEDITERRNAAEKLRTLNTDLSKALSDLKATQQQVIQQERLRALGQMASGIAHDFNNSLMPVMGFADLLIISPAILDDKKKALEYIETIRTAAKDAASIVARMREFYRSNEQGDVFVTIDPCHLVRQVVTLTQPKWKGQAQANGAEIQIIEELAETPRIVGDESALREVLTNLIFNAVDAMPGGGAITLRTRCEEKHAIIEVADSGVGMSEKVRQRCMEPFFSTKGERGTGLGLAMVFGIIQRHEGTIDLNSVPGKGTTFTLRFPLDAKAAGQTSGAKDGEAARPLQILVVDDEPQVRKVLTAFLETDGHTVSTADQGVNGLRCFLDGKFDLVITDKAMPGMSGDQMAVAIKQFAPRIPVVLLSGFNSGGDGEKIEGIDIIANKPITLPLLRETINKAMRAA